MPETLTHALEQEILRQRLASEQNAIEDELREVFLAENLFHWQHIRAYDSIEQIHQELSRLKQEFLAEKKDGNMGDRFDLALNPKYLGKISVVELGQVESIDPNDYAALKQQYNDLRHWLMINGVIADEIPRDQSGREVSYRSSVADPSRVVVIRQRPLIEADIPVRDEEGEVYGQAEFGIAKRQVFSVPIELAAIVRASAGDGDGYHDRIIQKWERLLGDVHPAIDRIRTGYYMISALRPPISTEH